MSTPKAVLGYLKSRSGRILLFQTIVSLAAFIVMVTEKKSENYGAFKFFAAISFMSFLISLGHMIIHFGDIKKSMTSFPWLLCQVVIGFIFIALFFLSSTIVAAKATYSHAGSAATMGFFLVASYCQSLYIDIKIYRSEDTSYEPQDNSGPEYSTTGHDTPAAIPPQYEPPYGGSTTPYQAGADSKPVIP